MSSYLFSIGRVTLFVTVLALPAQGREPSEPKGAPKEKSSAQDKTAAREVRNSVYLGIFTVPLRGINNRVKKGLQLKDDEGVIIVEVLPDSPATEAGLREKDVITRVNGKAIADQAALCTELNQLGAGKKVNLSILRRGEKQIIIARIKETTPEVITFLPYSGSEAGGAPAEKDASAARETIRRIQELERQISRLEKRLKELEKAQKAQVVQKP